MNKKIPEIALTALASVAPIPGLSLLMNKRVRRTALKAAGRLALVGAGVLVTVPVALYIICKTSGAPGQKN